MSRLALNSSSFCLRSWVTKITDVHYHTRHLNRILNIICKATGVQITPLICSWPWFLYKHSAFLEILGPLPKLRKCDLQIAWAVTHFKILNLTIDEAALMLHLDDI
jgi:hypothetical protein